MLYRIFTEDKDQEKIEQLCSKHFEGFTLTKGTGFWRLQKENSLIIEIVNQSVDDKINMLAQEIRDALNQESVLVQRIRNNQWLV